MRTLIFIVAAVAALSVASSTMASGRSAPTVSAKSSKYGKVLFDSRGFVLYAFTKDRHRSACSGACAKKWPPYVVRGGIRAAAGIKASLLATVVRADGSHQVTYAGRPLYHYIGDTKPGQILCQNASEFGGLWLVVRPNGKLVH